MNEISGRSVKYQRGRPPRLTSEERSSASRPTATDPGERAARVWKRIRAGIREEKGWVTIEMGSGQAAEPTRLVLVRHGESVATVRRRIGGPRTCEGLSPLGRTQAERLARRLAETSEIRADLLASSAFPRAVETASILEPVLGHSTSVIDGLGEHDPGPDCDGLSYDEFLERHGMPDWESDPYSITFPGGETIAQFHHRVWTTVRALLEEHQGATMVAVCHGGVIDAVLRGALRCSPTGIFEMHTTNTSLTELLWLGPGRWRLLRYNDAAHLVGLDQQTPRLESYRNETVTGST